jgi:hypothetical protein
MSIFIIFKNIVTEAFQFEMNEYNCNKNYING